MKVPSKIKEKIKTYYGMYGISDSSSIWHISILILVYYSQAIDGLPKSLYTEIILSRDRSMIHKTNIFNLGSPSFVVAASHYFKPRVAMRGDYVIRLGQIAHIMYFIKSGNVEILATDEETQIAIMKEGSFFGEIGLLLTEKRTVTVRALSFCVFETIQKDDFFELTQNFPNELQLLVQVARQRLKTTHPQDLLETKSPEGPKVEESRILRNIVTLEDFDSVQDKVLKVQWKSNSILGALWYKFVSFIRKYSQENMETFIPDSHDFLILPRSRFDNIWILILNSITFYNLLVIPFGIAFGIEFKDCDADVTVMETLHYITYFIDIFIHAQTAIKIR